MFAVHIDLGRSP